MQPDIAIEMQGDSLAALLDPLAQVHVQELLSAARRSDFEFVNGAPEPDERQLAWPVDCLGRLLASRYNWDDSLWAVEAQGVLVSPVYFETDPLQAHLVKSAVQPPGRGFRCRWQWLVELKAHCHLLHCERGSLHVYYVSPEPLLLRYSHLFLPQDIDAAWQVLLDLRAHYRPKETP